VIATPLASQYFTGWSELVPELVPACDHDRGYDGDGYFQVVVMPPVNGVCGTANGQTFPTAPTTNLCSLGAASFCFWIRSLGLGTV